SFDHGLAGVFRSWTPYALVAGGAAAILLVTTAYQAGHPTVSLPIITVTDPLVGALIGITLFGERLALGGSRGPVVTLALLAMAGGLVALGRDKRLTAAIVEGPSRAPVATSSCPPTPSAPRPAPCSMRGECHGLRTWPPAPWPCQRRQWKRSSPRRPRRWCWCTSVA